MWAKIISIKRTKDLNYFSLCALDLFNTRVSQFELNYWNKLTFPRHSNLRCIMWDGSDIIFPDKGWQYFRIHNLAQVYCVNLYMLFKYACGTEGRGTRSNHRVGWTNHTSEHTVFRGERSKIWQKWRYSSLLQQYKPRFSCTCAWQTLPVWKHKRSSCSAYAQLLRCSRVQCETRHFRHWGKWFPAVNSIFCKHVAVSSFHNLEWQKTFK